MYYVYVHKKYDGTVFYVGKGKNKRAWSQHSRNRFWRNITSKQQWSVEIVADGLQEWYALELETELIYLYGKRSDGGSLVNLVYTSHEQSQIPFTKEARAKLAITQAGLRNGRLNKKLYKFINLYTGETFTGLSFLFQKKYGINPSDIVNKNVCSVKGWVIEGGKLPKQKLVSDFAIYLFRHGATGEEFIGNRKEFQLYSGISVKNIFHPNRKGIKSWGVVRKVRDFAEEFNITPLQDSAVV